MSTVVKDLGAVSAYAYAVEKGYTGTEAEFAELMADYAEVGQRAEDAANSALESKTAAQTAATTATNKASEATTAAQTATTKAGEATTAAGTATTAKNDAVAAKTAAETAQGKAEDAQAAAESVAESIPSDYSQLSEDVSDLKEDLTQIENDLVQKGISLSLSDLETGLYYDGAVGDTLSEVSNNKSIYTKIDVSDHVGQIIKIELNALVTGSRCTGFCNAEDSISQSKVQPSLNSNAVLNEVTGLYEIELKITDEVFFFSYSNTVTTVNISIADVKKIYSVQETNAKITSELANPKFVHFSFDDVVFCMTDLTNNADNYDSIFDNPFFAKLKQVHDDYGTIFSLYLFTESISTWTAKFKTEFSANKDWLKFGLHVNRSTANNYSQTTAEQALADYNEFVEEIYRITGDYGCIDKCPRLSAFSGNQASCLAMRDADCGIVGLLSAYDDRDSYYLSSADSNYVFVHGRLYDPTNRITLFHTYKTIEAQNPITVTLPKLLTAEGNNGSEYLIMMGHEYAFYDGNYQLIPTYLDRIDYISDWANDHGYLWQYPMNRILR